MINLKPTKCQLVERQIIKLKTQLVKTQQEKEQLRLFLHEIIEAYYRTINQTKLEKEVSHD